MRDDEKIFGAFRKAALTAEDNPEFAAMEKVWNRVGEKLDRRELKSGMARWKKLAIAATIMLFCTMGYLFLADKDATENRVVISQPESEPEIDPKIQVLPLPARPDSTSNIIIIEPRSAVAQTAPAEDALTEGPLVVPPASEAASEYQPAVIQDKVEADVVAIEETQSQVEVMVAETKKTVPVKSEPLLVVDGKAIAGKNYSTRKSVEMDAETETIVLEEPLYIINGVEYSEVEMFGPNPTSPYAPLNRQEIESVKVLQGKEATDAYGEKGRKGVLIIKTKNGKPAPPPKANSR